MMSFIEYMISILGKIESMEKTINNDTLKSFGLNRQCLQYYEM